MVSGKGRTDPICFEVTRHLRPSIFQVCCDRSRLLCLVRRTLKDRKPPTVHYPKTTTRLRRIHRIRSPTCRLRSIGFLPAVMIYSLLSLCGSGECVRACVRATITQPTNPPPLAHIRVVLAATCGRTDAPLFGRWLLRHMCVCQCIRVYIIPRDVVGILAVCCCMPLARCG